MTKLALVLGGPASLGAYSAGAVTEILTAAAENRREPRVPVAVVTGAGLGAVSAALAARGLAVNRDLVPWIGRVWVDALDAEHLLPESAPPGPRVLDRGPLEELTAHTVAGPPAADDRPSPALGERLRLGIDLPGVGTAPEGAEARGAGGTAAVFELDAGCDAGHPVWQEVRRAALIASSPVLSLRPDGGGAEPGSAAAPGEPSSPRRSAEEERPRRPRPLALARRLVRSHGPRPSADEWRIVVVDPDGPGGEPSASPGPLASVLRAVRACLADEVVRDWSAARDASERVDLLRALARRLPEIHGRLDDPDAVGLGRRIGELAERVAERDERRLGSDDDPAADPALRRLDDSLRRIQAEPAYAPVFREVGSRAGRTRLAKLVYVLEAVGDLQGRAPARLHRIRPETPGTLAGDGLAGYGGFAVRAWRRHDFVAGRRDARRVLDGPLSDVVDHEPDDPGAYDPPPAPRLAAALERADRRSLRARMGSAAVRMLDAAAPRGLRGVFYRLARPGLRRSLAGRLMESLEPAAAR